jgi:hypothetical protein
MIIEYDSNNSGGHWWLEDKDWKNLKKAGWLIKWSNLDFQYDENGMRIKDSKGFPVLEESKKRLFLGRDGRYLGAIATEAFVNRDCVKDALLEFEKITGQEVSEEGCNCCGAPHCFSWDGGSCSGEGCLAFLYEKVPDNYREAVELLNKKGS